MTLQELREVLAEKEPTILFVRNGDEVSESTPMGTVVLFFTLATILLLAPMKAAYDAGTQKAALGLLLAAFIVYGIALLAVTSLLRDRIYQRRREARAAREWN